MMARSLGGIGYGGAALGRAEVRGGIYEGQREIEEYLQGLQDKLQDRYAKYEKGSFWTKVLNIGIPLLATVASGGALSPTMAAAMKFALPVATSAGRRAWSSDIEKKLDVPSIAGMKLGGSRSLLSGISEARQGATDIRQISQAGTFGDLISGYFGAKAGMSVGELASSGIASVFGDKSAVLPGTEVLPEVSAEDFAYQADATGMDPDWASKMKLLEESGWYPGREAYQESIAGMASEGLGKRARGDIMDYLGSLSATRQSGYAPSISQQYRGMV
jgi:hypothetical protein